MKSKASILIVVVLSLVAATLPVAAEQPFKVVVNQANPATSMSRAEVSKIFLKRTTTWDNGVQAEPVDLMPASEVRVSFSQEIHGRDVASIKRYWQSMIFSGRGVPPSERVTADEVIEFVGSTPGGVGYVAQDTPLGDGVKVLELVD